MDGMLLTKPRARDFGVRVSKPSGFKPVEAVDEVFERQVLRTRLPGCIIAQRIGPQGNARGMYYAVVSMQ